VYVLTLIVAAIVMRVTHYEIPEWWRVFLALIAGWGMGYSMGRIVSDRMKQ
jgi:hypothetical protein